MNNITNGIWGGDESVNALHLVIGKIVGDASPLSSPVLTPRAILERAETEGMLCLIVGEMSDPLKVLGWKLRALRGRRLIDSQGRRYGFDRLERLGAAYSVRFNA